MVSAAIIWGLEVVRKSRTCRRSARPYETKHTLAMACTTACTTPYLPTTHRSRYPVPSQFPSYDWRCEAPEPDIALTAVANNGQWSSTFEGVLVGAYLPRERFSGNALIVAWLADDSQQAEYPIYLHEINYSLAAVKRILEWDLFW